MNSIEEVWVFWPTMWSWCSGGRSGAIESDGNLPGASIKNAPNAGVLHRADALAHCLSQNRSRVGRV